MDDWKDVKRELGVNGSAEALEKIFQLWEVAIAARYLVRWWDHPDIHRGMQSPFISERERRLRTTLEILDGRPVAPNEGGAHDE